MSRDHFAFAGRQPSLLIKNGTIVNPVSRLVGDVLIDGERIAGVGPNIDLPADRIIDASGCLVIPGGIDVHTHLSLPQKGTVSADDFYTGTLAALHGGTTTVIDFGNQKRGSTLEDAFFEVQEKATGNACCDYGVHLAVTDASLQTLEAIPNLVRRCGVTSFKTFMAYDGLMLRDHELCAVMRAVRNAGGILTTHAEIGDEIDRLASKNLATGKTSPLYHAMSHPCHTEVDAVRRLIEMAIAERCPTYIVHVSCRESVEAIAKARAEGHWIRGETCPQYLFLDESLYEAEDFDAAASVVMSPPLRSCLDREALWDSLSQRHHGIDVVATDHCPFNKAQKRLGINDFSLIPNGVPGIEHRLELLFSEGVNRGRFDVNRFVELVSTIPARIFGLYPRKGIVAQGSDADIAIIDPRISHSISARTHHMSVDNSCYEGYSVRGKCIYTILRGQVVVDNGKSSVARGYGRYLARGHAAGATQLTDGF